MNDYTLNDDINRYEAEKEAERVRQHELEMREHNEDMAKIEAKKAKALAREERRSKNAEAYLITRVVIACIVTFLLLAGGCMYKGTLPNQVDKEKQEYETCMKYEKDDTVCSDDF